MKSLELMIDEARHSVADMLAKNVSSRGEYLTSKLPNTFTYTKECRTGVMNRIYVIPIPAIHIVFPSRSHRKMVAYTDDTGDIYINGRRSWTVCSLAGAITHELCHIAGYGHGGNWVTFWNKKKKYASVPYAVGKLVKTKCLEEDILKHIFKED